MAHRWWARARTWIVPVAVLCAVTLPHLGDGDWRTDTGRYAAAGLQAWRSLFGEAAPGMWWTPHLQPDRFYFNKPPLGLWIHGLSVYLFGPSVWAARLPSVIAAALCVLATIGAARSFHPRGVAMGAGVVLALTLEFFRRTREVSLDLWVAAFLMLAVWCVCLAVRRIGPRPRIERWFVWAGVFIGLSLLVKPLVGLAAVPILAGWLCAMRRWRLAGWMGIAGGVAVVVALPWHVSMAWLHGDAFTGRYFGAEIADRAAGEIQTKPWFDYVARLGETYWPWAIFVAGLCLAALRGRVRARDPRGLWLAALWTVVWLVVLSVFPDKRPRYAVVLYPTLAWLAAVHVVTGGGAELRTRIRPLWHAATRWGVWVLCAGALVFALVPIEAGKGRNGMWDRLGEWLGGPRADRLVVAGALDTNEQGRLYLERGAWPAWIGGDEIPERDDVPLGALIVDRSSRWAERLGERIVVRLEPERGHGDDGLVVSERIDPEDGSN